MAYRHTVISNLKYVDEVFHNIAHNIPHPNEQGYEGQDDSTLLKWECVDDRFSTGFGSTYEVPINDFPTREEEVEITIFGDTWLHVEEVPHEEHYMNKWETNEVTVKTDRVLYKESLPEVLQRVYPNGTINLVGDFSSSASIEIDLDDVWNYLQGLSSYPDYLIFNGVDKTLASEGKIYTIQKLKDIDSFLKEKKIKACCVFTATLEVENIDIKDYAEVFSTTTKMLKFSTYEWASHHLSLIESNYGASGNETGIDEFFGDISLKLSFDRLKYYIDENYHNYKELVYIVVKRFILTELFILHRECFYISLLYKSVHGGLGGTTYDFYFGAPSKPYDHISFFSKEEGRVLLQDPPGSANQQTKYGNNHSWNCFKQNGQFIAICLHTGFSEHLWACQQGHSSCHDEYTDFRLTSNSNSPAGLLQERIYVTGGGTGERRSLGGTPIFFGTGCSMLTISQENRQRYANKLGLSCPIELWITKDNYTASITVRLHTEKEYVDLYQSVEFGKMSAKETESYIYPLYCGGGSNGLSSDIYVYNPVSGGNKTHREGNVYDLNMDNICLSNSNILHPTKFYNCRFTNFKVLTSEGLWRSIYLHEQTASVVPYPSLGPSPDYAIHLNTPTHNLGRSQDGAYPFLMDNRYTIGSQHIKNRNWLCREPIDSKKVDFSSRLDAIRIGLNHSIGHGQYLSYGTIPHCWRSWDKEIPSGEFIFNGKKYLAVPCGWDGRLWDYGYHLDIHNDTWDFDEVVNEFEKYYYKQNARIEDKLIIELGDVDV